MSKDSIRSQMICKKSNIPPTMDLEAYLKNQQNIIGQLKNKLNDTVCKLHLLDSELEGKNNLIKELDECIKEREEEIHKNNTNLEALMENNKQILDEFNCFKKKFYQLETDYDCSLQQLNEEKQEFINNLEKQKSNENQKIQQLAQNCCDLQQKLQDNLKEFTKLNKLYLETAHNFEAMRKEFEKQTNDFENYKKQVNEERLTNEEKIKQEIEKLKEESIRKDDIINQCKLDKISLEKEKNLTIEELNNKILRIERAFSQPSKAVQPITNINQQDATNANYENFKNNNLTKIKPQPNIPLDNKDVSTLQDNNPTQHNYKFKHPALPASGSQQTDRGFASNSVNRKRRHQPVRMSTVNYNYSPTSSDDEDEESNVEFIQMKNPWRPNKRNDDSYVPDTDTSEGFAKTKRLRK